jgi:hypothetical protein
MQASEERQAVGGQEPKEYGNYDYGLVEEKGTYEASEAFNIRGQQADYDRVMALPTDDRWAELEKIRIEETPSGPSLRSYFLGLLNRLGLVVGFLRKGKGTAAAHVKSSCAIVRAAVEGKTASTPIYIATSACPGSLPAREVECDVPCRWASRSSAVVAGLFALGLEPPNNKVIVYSMEGEAYYPQLSLQPENRIRFGAMSTTSFMSEVPVPYFSFAEFLLQGKHVPLGEIEKPMTVMFMANNCGSKNNREGLVRAMMKSSLKVDSVSRCLNNVNVPGSEKADKGKFQRKYPLYLAFENQNVDDYMTEKLWGALAAGVIPVYWGASNVWHHVPPKSIINVGPRSVRHQR